MLEYRDLESLYEDEWCDNYLYFCYHFHITRSESGRKYYIPLCKERP